MVNVLGTTKMGLIISIVIISTILTLFVRYIISHLVQRHDLRFIPSPRSYPFIGHLLITRPDPIGFMAQVMGLGALYKDWVLLWLGTVPALMIYSPRLLQPVFGTSKHINKGLIYTFLMPWLGQSLLISPAERWRPKRKLLTPTFHYDILKDFIPVFNKQGTILIGKLNKIAKSENPIFDVVSELTLCTLDIVCETSMGRSVNAQLSQNSEYVKAVHKINDIIQNRTKNPLMWTNIAFNIFGEGKEHDRCLHILHSFTKKVIFERRQELKACDWRLEGRRAFLDLLLEMEHKGEMPTEDIAGEVDTFMFEGHDTTSTALSWALHLIGNNPVVLGKIQEELDNILGNYRSYITIEDMAKMTYLEAVIKETLRLYPSVPIVVRELGEDEEFDGTIVPKGTVILINIYLIQRDSNEWPDPEKFIPERHINGERNNAYAWCPFSAGARNCIGQRFAMLEMKTLLAEILHRFDITSLEKRYEVREKQELILRPSGGLNVKITPRIK